MSTPKIAVFGGAFNPIHYGHLQIAEVALQQVQLDSVLWVPTFSPVHKSSVNLLPFEHRMVMLSRAIAPYPQFVISNVEQQYGAVSYASTTLLHLNQKYPQANWYWLIGLDAFKTLSHWRHSLDLAQQCHWLVAPRDQGSASLECGQMANYFAVHNIQLDWTLLSMPEIPISSTYVRQQCLGGRSLENLVPKAVEDYIIQHKLYR
jgi:nicotinate-nucleotide adenylyltransferase